jgi:pyruvate/2-oxoglutarate dehydrogenase complex dihydrolipoamide acyltransferase (E2) component
MFQLVCIIVESQEEVAAFKDFKDDGSVAAPKESAPKAEPTPAPPAAVAAPPAPAYHPSPVQVATAPSAGGRVFASPFARKLAAEKGLDISVSSNQTIRL